MNERWESGCTHATTTTMCDGWVKVCRRTCTPQRLLLVVPEMGYRPDRRDPPSATFVHRDGRGKNNREKKKGNFHILGSRYLELDPPRGEQSPNPAVFFVHTDSNTQYYPPVPRGVRREKKWKRKKNHPHGATEARLHAKFKSGTGPILQLIYFICGGSLPNFRSIIKSDLTSFGSSGWRAH